MRIRRSDLDGHRDNIRYIIIRTDRPRQERTSSKSPKKTRQTPAAPRIADPPSQADFDEVVRMIEAAGPTLAAVDQADQPLLEHRRVHQPPSRHQRWGKGTVEALARHIHRRQPNARLLRPKPLAHDAVLRDLPRPAKTRTTVARIVLNPQPDHHEPLQARRGTRILPACLHPRALDQTQLQRQVNGALFEHTVLSPKMSPAVTE